MKQRLGIAAALLGDPELVILDEPTNGLDPVGMQDVRALIGEIAGHGRTVLVSSHLLSELEQVCDWLVVIDRGGLVHLGPPDTLAGTDRLVLRAADASRADDLAVLAGSSGLRTTTRRRHRARHARRPRRRHPARRRDQPARPRRRHRADRTAPPARRPRVRATSTSSRPHRTEMTDDRRPALRMAPAQPRPPLVGARSHHHRLQRRRARRCRSRPPNPDPPVVAGSAPTSSPVPVARPPPSSTPSASGRS